MPLTVEQAQGRVPVTVLAIQGDLDYSNYLEVIEQVQGVLRLRAPGTCSSTSRTCPFMGSSGLVALHSAALIMSGQSAAGPGGRLAGVPRPRRRRSEAQTNVKLLGLQPRVEQMLQRTALLRFFETFTDRALAIDSF